MPVSCHCSNLNILDNGFLNFCSFVGEFFGQCTHPTSIEQDSFFLFCFFTIDMFIPANLKDAGRTTFKLKRTATGRDITTDSDVT